MASETATIRYLVVCFKDQGLFDSAGSLVLEQPTGLLAHAHIDLSQLPFPAIDPICQALQHISLSHLTLAIPLEVL